MLTMVFMIATQDNPLIKEFIKPKPKYLKLRIDDLARHISIIGACLFILVSKPYPQPEE